MSRFWTKLSQKMIGQAIRDLGDRSTNDYETALAYVRSDKFITDCEEARYPIELRDALDEMVQLSDVEKRVVIRDIMRELKKTPH